jgi:hypothetical protein
LLNLELHGGVFSVGGVIGSKFTTWESSCSLMHLIAPDGSGVATMSAQVLLGLLALSLDGDEGHEDDRRPVGSSACN